MALTSPLLLIVCILGALGALTGTVFLWKRGGRLRVPVRVVNVLLCEALALFVGGLVLNNALDLYPSWTALVHQNDPAKAAQPTAQPVIDGGTDLDIWLRSRATEGAKNGLVFDWKPKEWTQWHLAAPPTVYLPPQYFTGDGARFPVVIVAARAKAGPQQAGWDPKGINTLVHAVTPQSTSAIAVFLRVEKPDGGQLLNTLLPDRLGKDLRLVEHGWAVIGVGVDAPFALTALNQRPDRYGCAAAVSDAPGELTRTYFAGYKTRVGRPVFVVDGPGAAQLGGGGPGSPAAGSGAPTGGATSQPLQTTADGLTANVVPQLDQRLTAALRLVFPFLAAPLANPLVGPVGPLPPPPAQQPGTKPKR